MLALEYSGDITRTWGSASEQSSLDDLVAATNENQEAHEESHKTNEEIIDELKALFIALTKQKAELQERIAVKKHNISQSNTTTRAYVDAKKDLCRNKETNLQALSRKILEKKVDAMMIIFSGKKGCVCCRSKTLDALIKKGNGIKGGDMEITKVLRKLQASPNNEPERLNLQFVL